MIGLLLIEALDRLRVRLNIVSCSIQDHENASSWSDAYTMASNGAGDNPDFNVDYQSHFEWFAKWIWARRTPTEGSRGSSVVTGLNCAFCRADQLAKQLDKADVRGKCVHVVRFNGQLVHFGLNDCKSCLSDLFSICTSLSFVLLPVKVSRI